MSFDASRDHRRSIRFAGYDYRAAGAYFVTVCASRRGEVFGKIENGAVTLNAYGRIIAEEWQHSTEIRAEIELDIFIVMPDHFHAIVFFVGACGGTPNESPSNLRIQSRATEKGVPPHAPTPPSRDLGALINGFKGAVTRRVNVHRDAQNRSPVVVWQRNYYERIIRDENELNETRRYISQNPSRPRADAEH